MKLDSSKPKQDRGLRLNKTIRKSVRKQMQRFAYALESRTKGSRSIGRPFAERLMAKRSKSLVRAADLLKREKDNPSSLTSEEREIVIDALKICRFMRKLEKSGILNYALNSGEIFYVPGSLELLEDADILRSHPLLKVS